MICVSWLPIITKGQELGSNFLWQSEIFVKPDWLKKPARYLAVPGAANLLQSQSRKLWRGSEKLAQPLAQFASSRSTAILSCSPGVWAPARSEQLFWDPYFPSRHKSKISTFQKYSNISLTSHFELPQSFYKWYFNKCRKKKTNVQKKYVKKDNICSIVQAPVCWFGAMLLRRWGYHVAKVTLALKNQILRYNIRSVVYKQIRVRSYNCQIPAPFWACQGLYLQ